jgi:hypothetical protein
MFNFQNFKTRFKQVFPTKPQPDDNFLCWFIGFTEGDGCFTVTKRNDLHFIVVQGNLNQVVLQTMKDKLCIGNIIKQGSRVMRFIVQKKEHLELIILLFNGNLILSTRKTQFNKFINAYNIKPFSKPIPYIRGLFLPCLENSWILGFTEAEGCFTISLLDNSKAFRTRFILTQSNSENLGILSHFILLFSTGKIEGHYAKNCYSFIVSGLANVLKIYSYFDRFAFVGIKGQSYEKFKLLNRLLSEKQHFNPQLRKELITLSHEINRFKRKIK